MIRALVPSVFALLATVAPAQDRLLWGSLEPGQYSVGYRSTIQFDPTRQYDPDYVTTPGVARVSKPRPILVDIWYPAKRTTSAPMPYSEYFNVQSDDAKATTFAQRLRYNIREVVCEETVGHVPAKTKPEEMAAFERLLSTKTFAVKNAPTASGRFPVVIYHSGSNGTPEENSALFEYLASHGYVVISSAYQDTDGYDVHCGGGDLPCSFRDMEFLCRYARGLSFVDADRLGAMGHSFGAWATVCWATEPDASVRAFVSLDSGLEYDSVETSGVESLQYQMKHNPNSMRASSFRAASAERKADFNLIDSYLRFADRYEATATGLTHNDFLTHGAMRPALLPAKWPDAVGLRRSSYDQICNHVLYFFDAMLKGQTSAREALARSVRGEGLKPGFALGFRPAAPLLPSARQLSQYVRQNGVEKAVALMASLGKGSESVFAAAHVLFEDGDVKTALSVLRRIDADHPNLAHVQALLGQALLLSGDRAGALEAFRKGKALIDGDKTVGSIWKFYINEGLKELGEG